MFGLTRSAVCWVCRGRADEVTITQSNALGGGLGRRVKDGICGDCGNLLATPGLG